MNRIVVTGCVALGTVGVLAAAMSGARAAPKATDASNERDLVVTLITPTINQEVLPDLSDPGLNNLITVRFSSMLLTNDIIDNQNVVNRLSSRCEFLNSGFARLPGTPSVRRNIFTFDPFSVATPVLPQGQYTLNLKSSIRNTRGRLLNNGVADYTATFSVGTDVYPPVLRKINPLMGQTGLDLFQKITATFNEPLEFATLPANVLLQDASTNPPTNLTFSGVLTRGGFDIVLTPDPCFGLPPKTNIQVIFQGQGKGVGSSQTNAITDVFQNKFGRDLSLAWTVDPTIQTLYHSPNGDFDEVTGQFKMVFQTKGVRPPPQGLKPGGPMMNFPPPYASPCNALLWLAPSCKVSGNCVNYTTDSSFGELDLRQYIARFNQGVTDYSLISILPNTPVKMGRPAGVTFDPRIIGQLGTASDFHTYIYIVDEKTGTVEVVRSDNFKIVGRFTGFSSPRDVSVSTNPQQSATTLYVSAFGANQVVGLDLETIAVTFGTQPGQVSPCAAIKDNQKTRATITTGAGPTEVSADSYLHQRVMVTNSLSNSVAIINPATNKVLKTYDVGSFPISCDWCTFNFGQIKFAMIANQGGLNDPDGSVSLYVNSPPLSGSFPGAAQVRDGVEATFTDGVKNPTHVFGNLKWITPPPPSNPPLTSAPIFWLISNTGGRTVMNVGVQFSGLFGIAITPTVNGTFDCGLNPTSACGDAFYPNGDDYMSVVGTGSVSVVDPTRSLDPFPVPVPGVRRLFTCYTN
jgi:YVTN family beta-propeller protein